MPEPRKILLPNNEYKRLFKRRYIRDPEDGVMKSTDVLMNDSTREFLLDPNDKEQ